MNKTYPDLMLAFQKICRHIDTLLERNECPVIAIEGRCGAGKTTLARLLGEKYGCSVIHIDDFFLQPQQRTRERLGTPGGNIDHERFYEEVIRPLLLGKSFSYRPYICASDTMGTPVFVSTDGPLVIEGSYSCHPALSAHYDLKIFLSVDGGTQLFRILQRSGKEMTERFRKVWIPMEEEYFSFFKVAENCDLYFEV